MQTGTGASFVAITHLIAPEPVVVEGPRCRLNLIVKSKLIAVHPLTWLPRTNEDGKHSLRTIRCDWRGCAATFTVEADAEVYKHVNCTHHIFEKYIDCPIESCDRKGENGFANKDHLLKHKREFHCMDLPKRHRKTVRTET